MEETNVERLRRGFDAFNRGDFDAASEVWHPQVEWRNVAGEGAPRGAGMWDGVYRGPDGIRRFWDEFLGVWDEWHMRIENVVEVRPGVLLVDVLFTARGQGSAVPIEFPYAQVATFRDGKVVSVDSYLDRAAAHRAARLD